MWYRTGDAIGQSNHPNMADSAARVYHMGVSLQRQEIPTWNGCRLNSKYLVQGVPQQHYHGCFSLTGTACPSRPHDQLFLHNQAPCPHEAGQCFQYVDVLTTHILYPQPPAEHARPYSHELLQDCNICRDCRY